MHYYLRDNGVYKIDLSNGNETLVQQFKSIEQIDARGKNLTAILGRTSLVYDDELDIGRLDSEFNTYWENEYKVDHRVWSRAVIADLDFGGVYMVREETNSGKFRAVVVKTDCNGNMDKWEECTLGEEEQEVKSNPIKLFPNPANNEITLQTNLTGEYAIYSVDGQELKGGEVSGELTAIGIDELISGAYVLQFRGTVINSTVKFLKR